MNREDLFAICTEILSEVLHVPRESIHPKSNIMLDLGGDSLDLLRLSVRIEERFNLRLSDDDLVGVQTVDDMMSHLERKLTEGAADEIPFSGRN